MVLERELAIFEAHRLRWLHAHAHQYALIIGDDVLGFYATPEGPCGWAEIAMTDDGQSALCTACEKAGRM